MAPDDHPNDDTPTKGPGRAAAADHTPAADDEAGQSTGPAKRPAHRPDPGLGAAAPTPSTSEPGPESARPAPDSRARRDFVEDVAAELASQRRSVAENATLLAEALPRLDDLAAAVHELGGRVDHVTAAPGRGHLDSADATTDSEHGSAESTGASDDSSGQAHSAGIATAARGGASTGSATASEPSPSGADPAGVAGRQRLRQRIAREHGLGVDEPDDPAGVALCWPTLTVEQAAAAWEDLARFVAGVLNGWYPLTRAQLPDCWPAHRRAVVELSWLHQTYREAVDSDAGPVALATWHTRWLPAAVHGLAAAIDPDICAPGRHHDPSPRPTTPPDAGPGSADAPPGPWAAGVGQRRPAATGHNTTPTPGYNAARAGGGYLTPRPAPTARPTGHRDDVAERDHVKAHAAEALSDPSCWSEHYRTAAAADLAARRGLFARAASSPENRPFQLDVLGSRPDT